MRGPAARGAGSLLCLCAGLAFGPARARAAEGAPAPPAAAARPAGDSLLAEPGDWGAPDGRPIGWVIVEPHDIFDPAPEGPLARVYRLADRIHVRTRPSTIRTHLLIRPGQTSSETRARESARALRALNIFDAVRVRSRMVGDSAEVRVQTRDAWTTTPEFSLERGGGELFGSVRFAERNLLGRGQRIGVAYRHDPAGISRSIELGDPGVRGTHVAISAYASEGTSGTNQHGEVTLPFYAEETSHSFSVRANRARATARLFDRGVERAHFSRSVGQAELVFGMGERHGRTITRWVGSFLVVDRSFGASIADAGAPAEFAGAPEQDQLRRFTSRVHFWRPSYVERNNVDQLDGIEDFDLGRSLSIALGVSPRGLGSRASEGFVGAGFDLGIEGGRAGFGWVRAGYSARLIAGPREAVGRIEARWVNQSMRRHTLVVAGQGVGSWRPARDFQLVAGGLSGLRAHPIYALSGDQLWRWNAESRWVIRRNLYQLISIGAAGFWDAARMRGPGSGQQPWQHDAGLGLRLGFPRSSLNRVARIDVAWPISPSGASFRDVVFSFGSSQGF